MLLKDWEIQSISHCLILDAVQDIWLICFKVKKSALYCGLDLSPEMLKVAKRKLPESVFLTEGSSDNLSYDDGGFDVVTCVQSFHHYPQPEKAMAEAYRVLRSNGLYNFQTPVMAVCRNGFIIHFFWRLQIRVITPCTVCRILKSLWLNPDLKLKKLIKLISLFIQ